MSIHMFLEYSFLVVALGTVCLAVASGVIGTVSVLKGQSLIGDAVGHASFPGIVLAFLLIKEKNVAFFLVGAMLTGLFAYQMIQTIDKTTKVSADTAMAVVLSAMFGLGMVLKSYIQGNTKIGAGSQAGLATYIFGQAAYMLKEDVISIFLVSLVSLAFFVICYRMIKMNVFDATYSGTLGISNGKITMVIMFMTMMLIVVGLKAVGAILISNMLITPGVTGLQWSNRYGKVVAIAATVGGVSALLGTVASTAVDGISTGPAIILVMSVIALVSMVFSPKGVLAMCKKRKKIRG